MAPKPLLVPGPLEPFDERDTVFARTRLKPGTPEHDSYYANQPDLLSTDDRTRRLPNLAGAGTPRYRKLESALIESQFSASDLIATAVEHTDNRQNIQCPDGLGSARAHEPSFSPSADPIDLNQSVRDIALFLGAEDVGVATLDPAHVYTHRGRPSQAFGETVRIDHKYAIVLVFPMRKAFTRAAPEMIATAEVARIYQQAAAATFALSETLMRIGHKARAHVDSNYLLICPPLAVDAGMGELGRNGIFVHRTRGPGVRLGVVTTNAPIIPDTRQCFGIGDFCSTCAKCAKSCPAKAIPEGESSIVRGAEKWPLHPERCYHYWRTQGTDCGVCIRTCPFDKPNTTLHRMVRGTIRRTNIFNRLLLWGDDLFYGRNPGPKRPPLPNLG